MDNVSWRCYNHVKQGCGPPGVVEKRGSKEANTSRTCCCFDVNATSTEGQVLGPSFMAHQGKSPKERASGWTSDQVTIGIVGSEEYHHFKWLIWGVFVRFG